MASRKLNSFANLRYFMIVSFSLCNHFNEFFLNFAMYFLWVCAAFDWHCCVFRGNKFRSRPNVELFIRRTKLHRKLKFMKSSTSGSVWGARVAQSWEHSPPTNVARVQIPASTPYVGWVCCWFSPLLREVFLRVLRFSPLLKNQHFQIPIRPGIW